jgi:hypothetical protein
MGWERAKSILIGLLLVLNLVLAVVSITSALSASDVEAFNRDAIQILEGRGVTVSCALPAETVRCERPVYQDGDWAARAMERVGELAATWPGEIHADVEGRPGAFWVEYEDPQPEPGLAGWAGWAALLNGAAPQGEGGGAGGEPTPQGEGDGAARQADEGGTGAGAPAETALREALAARGFDLSGFVEDYCVADAEDNLVAHYVLEYQGRPVFDSVVSAAVSPAGAILRVAVNGRAVEAADGRARTRVVPAYQVLLRHYTQESSAGQAIATVDVGYMADASSSGLFAQQDAIPVWRVQLSDGTARYFEGVYGDELDLESLGVLDVQGGAAPPAAQ